ncbi:RAD55 family ATPase [Haloplanus halobius]|uniref:RAD55 family ATPase n=1 Tax=Haloplanus halobius TaxID=2934938 RepID=UPI0020108F6A|nr:recombinase RecA [Haloplanus sp. XH21]
MYDLGPPLNAEVDEGTNLLLSGPALTGKKELAFDILTTGVRNDEGAIVVSNTDGAKRVFEAFSERIDYEDRPLAVVDCVTRQQGVSDIRDDPRIRYTSSPVDMTGVGIKFSELLQEFYEERGIERNRVFLDSLSTLLMYSDLQTVFRFLHVFTGRVQSVDGLGLYAIDSSAHDDKTMNTLKQLFDGVIETREDAEPTARLPGN